MTTDITLTDLFCGAGGSSTGATQVPNVTVRVASNHWQKAVDTHNVNHQDADHICADISQIDPRYFPRTTMGWMSPECTNHSIARGKKQQIDQGPDLFGDALPAEAAERSRATMWDVVRFSEVHRYEAVIVENVVDAANWGPFKAWLMAMDCLGYDHRVVYLNSMHAWAFGDPAPQSRDRMYVVFWRKGNRVPDLEHMQRPPAWCPEHGEVRAMQAWKNPDRRWGRYRQQYLYRCPQVSCRNRVVEPNWIPAASIIDWTELGTRIGDRPRPLAEKTMARIRAGIARYWGEDAQPLVVNHVSGADASRSSTVHDVAPTMVAGGLHASLLVPVEGRAGKDATPVGLPYRTQTTRNETGIGFPPVMHLEAAGNTYDAADPKHRAHGRADGYYRVWDGGQPFKTMHTTASKAVAFPPFIAELRGGGSDVRSTTDSLSTVTASGNHHGLVTLDSGDVTRADVFAGRWDRSEPTPSATTTAMRAPIEAEDCSFRMLSPAEIKRAMAFPAEYQILGNRREQVRMSGNAVTPPAARDLIAAVVDTL